MDVRGETGLLTYAGECRPKTGCFPSRRLAASVGGSWLAFTPLGAAEAACAITVAGQWRSFTALPEHSVAGKGYVWDGGQSALPAAGFETSLVLCGGLVHLVQFFSGLEAYGLAWCDADLGSGARVASDAGLAGLDGEDAEATQLDAVARNQRLFHAAEDGIDRALRLRSGKSGSLDDPLDQVLFNQLRPPLSR